MPFFSSKTDYHVGKQEVLSISRHKSVPDFSSDHGDITYDG